MHPNIPPESLPQILEISTIEASESREACGIITTSNEVEWLENSAPHPDQDFLIKNIDYPKSQIKLIWHSHYADHHPGEFTHADLNLSHQMKIPILLYHVGFDEWDYYEPNNPDPWPLKPSVSSPQELDFYTKWRFCWGRSDCFSLVRRYFLGTQGKDIGEFLRPNPEETAKSGWDFTRHWNYESNGFQPMPYGTAPQDGDIFGIALRGGRNANHLAVMVDARKNLILHSVGKNRLSRIDRFDDTWRKLVVPGGHGRLIQNN